MIHSDQTGKHLLRAYGCGGMGTNLVKAYQAEGKSDSLIDGAYIDTSGSNLSEENRKQAYLVNDLDGSGKKRDLNVEPIRKHIGPMLTSFPPDDVNLVVFSASGGSGSVIGPLLVDELLSRNRLVIPVVLGDTDSMIAASNTYKTIQTLSALSSKHKKPISIIYREMAVGSLRVEVDQSFHQSILALSWIVALTNTQNSEVDTMDVTNWLNYQRVTPHEPGLGLINIASANDKLDEQYDALSVFSIYGSPSDAHGEVHAAYRATGYVGHEMGSPLHFLITQAGLNAIADGLKRKLDEYDEKAKHIAAQHVELHERSEGSDFMVL